MVDSQFLPKQSLAKDPELYDKITADTTRNVAAGVLQSLPDISAHSRVHDVGCGLGQVSEVLIGLRSTMSATGPLQIQATDIDQPSLDALDSLVKSNSWPISTNKMSAEKMSFPADSFDLSFANYVIFQTPDEGLGALREMHRTTRPGGSVIFTSWKNMPYLDAVRAAFRKVRSGTSGQKKTLREMPDRWFDGGFWAGQGQRAGFDASQIEIKLVPVQARYADARDLATMMWSWLGTPMEGWDRQDEEQWDSAIDVTLGCMRSTEGFNVMESGEVTVDITGLAVIMAKS